jgi:STE24 endopeptidase
VLTVILAAVFANLLLRPPGPTVVAAPVDVHDWFSTEFLARAKSFRGLQSWLSLLASLVMLAVPLVVALVGPSRLRPASGVAKSSALTVVVVALTLLCTLPFSLAMFARANDVGLAVQPLSGWLGDWALATLLTLLAAFLFGLLAAWLLRRLPRTWWVALWAVLVALSAAYMLLAPIAIDPLFANFKRVESGALHDQVEQVAKQSGVHAGSIWVVDAAARTTGANAYVTGIGATRRVVVYDTLLKDFTAAERRQVLAHEFGHARYDDVIHGLIWFALVAFAALLAIGRVLGWLVDEHGLLRDSPRALVWLLTLALLATAVAQPFANSWSRTIERRADVYAIELTGRPNTAIALERRLTINNLSRPQPPAALQFLFGTHPTPAQRIGIALAMRDQSPADDRD